MKKNRGFTLVEMLMVMLLVAILAAVAIPQFLNFQTEARNAATQSSLAALRTGIVNQRSQMILRCSSTAWPPLADLSANDITTSACTAGQVVSPADRKFVAGSGLPVNPWGNVSTVIACTDCTRGDVTACDGSGTFTGGWCYNVATGEIWADSQSNGGTPTEESF